MLHMNSLTCFFCLGVVAALFALTRRRHGNKHPYPPGPSPKWFIGNLFDIPATYPWIRFSEWAKTFGGITYARILGQPLIILNTLEDGKKLMARASGRPICIMHELMGMTQDMSTSQDTPRWRYERKLSQIALGSQAVKAFHGVQTYYAAKFLKKIFEAPNAECKEELRDALGKSIFAIIYGLPTEGHFDQFIRLNSIVSGAFLSAQIPGKYLVESIPILRFIPSWFPGAGFKRHAQRVVEIRKGYAAYFVAAKSQIVEGKAPPSFVANCLQAQAAGQVDPASPLRVDGDPGLKYLASEMYRAAVHTTAHTVIKFIAAMQLHPSVQRKAQDEIMRVVGPDRLPSAEDRDSLPYVNAVITEAHRWHPSLAVGLPHRMAKDEEYRGFFFARETHVICNQWNLSLLAEDGGPLDRPDDFIPERFLPGAAAGMRTADPREYVFGFGRRICPGRHLAENSLFLTITSILATAWISSPPSCDNGEDAPPFKFSWTGEDAFSYPEPFHPVLTPRSPKAVELIHAAYEAGSTGDYHSES